MRKTTFLIALILTFTSPIFAKDVKTVREDVQKFAKERQEALAQLRQSACADKQAAALAMVHAITVENLNSWKAVRNMQDTLWKYFVDCRQDNKQEIFQELLGLYEDLEILYGVLP